MLIQGDPGFIHSFFVQSMLSTCLFPSSLLDFLFPACVTLYMAHGLVALHAAGPEHGASLERRVQNTSSSQYSEGFNLR